MSSVMATNWTSRAAMILGLLVGLLEGDWPPCSEQSVVAFLDDGKRLVMWGGCGW
ncbi:hypothetical protein G5C60_35000 [Streptomyces sp. HC44]|uniref:Uncharacterized protein n=1 Tax=Streptomyces scabichelini TaxID=2711217 RepID=A0A6G4VFX6_9ACTN|nr:hypothetical protein [Streptomyces scabichelini]NGO12683.1 hypothetical protein [Streptomyces scabichelini]